MLKRRFGPAEVPIIGQGTWKLHGKEAVDALRVGIDLGLTHIDTAEMYGTEEMVAEAIEGRRDEVFLVFKVLPSNATRKGTVRACEQSLKRLRTDRLDCYLLHWPGEHPLEETIAAFEELQAKGKIRSYGVGNFDEKLLERAASRAGADRLRSSPLQPSGTTQRGPCAARMPSARRRDGRVQPVPRPPRPRRA